MGDRGLQLLSESAIALAETSLEIHYIKLILSIIEDFTNKVRVRRPLSNSN